MVESDGARVRVMAGESSGATGPIALRNPGILLDVTLAKGASFTQQVSERSARRIFCMPYVLHVGRKVTLLLCLALLSNHCQLTVLAHCTGLEMPVSVCA